jgi:hypothetical protein
MMAANYPLEWADVKSFDNNPPEKALHRVPYQNILYGKHKKKLKDAGKTLTQHILEFIFKSHDDEKFVVTLNQFPYNVASDIVHMVVWENPITKCKESEIRKYLDGIVGRDNYSMFENAEAHRSINDIRHYQLFVKKSVAGKVPVVEIPNV